MLGFAQGISQANIFNNCVNSSSCSYTYEEVYQSLSQSEKKFNISHALYPGRSKPSSVRVFVNVYGRNKSKNSTPAADTWSMSCLYAAVPDVVLQVLSLGSILVSPRTQELNIHIPSAHFAAMCQKTKRKGDKRHLHERFCEHRLSVQNHQQLAKPTPVSEHFNLPGHSVNDIRLIPLELIHTNRDSVRKAREAHLIDKAKTLEPQGLNRRDELY